MMRGDDQGSPRGILVWLRQWIAGVSAGVAGIGWTWLQTSGGDAVGTWLVRSVPPVWLLSSIGIMLCALVYLGVSVLVYRKKGQSFLERIEPVPGQGYAVDPQNGELVCPVCAAAQRKAYLARASESALFCQCCKNGYKVFSQVAG